MLPSSTYSRQTMLKQCVQPNYYGRSSENQAKIIDYEQQLDQFWSDGTADQGSMIPMRLEKYASKTERPMAKAVVGVGTDEDTRSLVVY